MFKNSRRCTEHSQSGCSQKWKKPQSLKLGKMAECVWVAHHLAFDGFKRYEGIARIFLMNLKAMIVLISAAPYQRRGMGRA